MTKELELSLLYAGSVQAVFRANIIAGRLGWDDSWLVFGAALQIRMEEDEAPTPPQPGQF